MAFHADVDPNSIWTCPCGYTGPYKSVISHRKGYKNRPDCRQGTGKIHPVEGGESPPEDTDDIVPGGHDVGTSRHANVYEFLPEMPGGSLDDADPETLARWMNQQFYHDTDGSAFDGLDISGLLPSDDGDSSPPPGHNGGRPPGNSLPAGDWTVENPPPDVQPSMRRQPVVLPLYVEMMYDWARGQGWHVGDGSIATFVADVMVTHFRQCMHKRVLVVSDDELELATSGQE